MQTLKDNILNRKLGSINASAFASTFYFFSTHKAKAEKNKKSLQANAPDSADISANLVRHSCGQTEARTDNSTYPKGGILCFKDSFVVNQTLVFQIKFCGKIPALRVAAKRWAIL
jgi:hypothetical protein